MSFLQTASTLRTLTLKDHLEGKKYAAKKEVQKAKNSSSNAPSTSQQMALGMAVKSRYPLRAEFVLDCVKMHMVPYLKRPTRGFNRGEYKKNDHAVLHGGIEGHF